MHKTDTWFRKPENMSNNSIRIRFKTDGELRGSTNIYLALRPLHKASRILGVLPFALDEKNNEKADISLNLLRIVLTIVFFKLSMNLGKRYYYESDFMMMDILGLIIRYENVATNTGYFILCILYKNKFKQILKDINEIDRFLQRSDITKQYGTLKIFSIGYLVFFWMLNITLHSFSTVIMVGGFKLINFGSTIVPMFSNILQICIYCAFLTLMLATKWKYQLLNVKLEQILTSNCDHSRRMVDDFKIVRRLHLDLVIVCNLIIDTYSSFIVIRLALLFVSCSSSMFYLWEAWQKERMDLEVYFQFLWILYNSIDIFSFIYVCDTATNEVRNIRHVK